MSPGCLHGDQGRVLAVPQPGFRPFRRAAYTQRVAQASARSVLCSLDPSLLRLLLLFPQPRAGPARISKHTTLNQSPALRGARQEELCVPGKNRKAGVLAAGRGRPRSVILLPLHGAHGSTRTTRGQAPGMRPRARWEEECVPITAESGQRNFVSQRMFSCAFSFPVTTVEVTFA